MTTAIALLLSAVFLLATAVHGHPAALSCMTEADNVLKPGASIMGMALTEYTEGYQPASNPVTLTATSEKQGTGKTVTEYTPGDRVWIQLNNLPTSAYFAIRASGQAGAFDTKTDQPAIPKGNSGVAITTKCPSQLIAPGPNQPPANNGAWWLTKTAVGDVTFTAAWSEGPQEVSPKDGDFLHYLQITLKTTSTSCPCANCPPDRPTPYQGACCRSGVTCETQNWTPKTCVEPYGVWCPAAPSPAPTPTPAPTGSCEKIEACGPLNTKFAGPSASGNGALALGQGTKAAGAGSVAAGYYSATTKAGIYGTASGFWTIASGQAATAFGQSTTAHCGGGYACSAFGWNINNTESQSLAVSGNVHALNVKMFGADARLAGAVKDADPARMLANVKNIRVVERAPSENFCKHQGRNASACASDRSVGLIAQQVGAVIPGAVGSGASLTLVDAANAGGIIEDATNAKAKVLEEVEAVQGLDAHAMFAQLVGAVQALSAQIKGEKHRTQFGTEPILTSNGACQVCNAFGTIPKATGPEATAIGDGALASGQAAIAFGRGNNATGTDSIAMGRDSTASGPTALAVGSRTLASGVNAISTGENTIASGQNSAAFGIGTKATVANSVAFGQGSVACGGNSAAAFGWKTNASSWQTFAIGSHNNASGVLSFATGQFTSANGLVSVTMGQGTKTEGINGVAMGSNTTAFCGAQTVHGGGACVAMGQNINATKPDTVAASGTYYGHNYLFNSGDARLSANVTDADTSQMLANIEKIRVVERSPSQNYCKHQGRTLSACASDRTPALLAQQVGAVIPGAVGSGASLTLVDAAKRVDFTTKKEGTHPHPRPPVLEKVEAVLGLDVHALLAQQVGALQALSAQVKLLAKQNAAQAKLNAELKTELLALRRRF